MMLWTLHLQEWYCKQQQNFVTPSAIGKLHCPPMIQRLLQSQTTWYRFYSKPIELYLFLLYVCASSATVGDHVICAESTCVPSFFLCSSSRALGMFPLCTSTWYVYCMFLGMLHTQVPGMQGLGPSRFKGFLFTFTACSGTWYQVGPYGIGIGQFQDPGHMPYW